MIVREITKYPKIEILEVPPETMIGLGLPPDDKDAPEAYFPLQIKWRPVEDDDDDFSIDTIFIETWSKRDIAIGVYELTTSKTQTPIAPLFKKTKKAS